MWNIFEPIFAENGIANREFCINSLFKINGEEQVTTYPQIHAVVRNDKIVIAIDKSAVFVEDANITKCNFICFGSKIDCVAFSKSGNIIICALTDGDIVGALIKGILIFKLSINKDDIKPDRTFLDIHQYENSYYVTCANGSVYRIQDVEDSLLEPFLNTSIEENDDTVAETILENIKIECLLKKKSSVLTAASTIIPYKVTDIKTSEKFTTISATTKYLSFHDNNEDISILLPDSYQGIKKFLNLNNFILGMSNSGVIFEICPYTKIIYMNIKLDYLIADISIMKNTIDSIELLILTKPNELGAMFMKIIEFPSLKTKFEMDITGNIWLVDHFNSSLKLYYLSGDNSNSDNLPREILMKSISEIQPELRFKHLIENGQFEEAEIVGKEFHLSLQPIYEAQAKTILNEIESLNDNNMELIQLKFQELLKTLKLIEDKEYFVGIRSIQIPSRQIMAEFLDEMLNHLQDEIYQAEILEIKEQQLRLQTLCIIDPYECNLDWQSFVHHQNITKVCTNLYKTNMLTACLIWKRHAASIIKNLNENEVFSLMKMIPSETEPFNIIQWLRYFVPSTVQSYPKIVPFMIEWNIQRTRSLQFSNYWPEIGLEYAIKVLQIFDRIQFLHSDIRRQFATSIDKLKNLVNILEDLSELKINYNIILTMDDYTKELMDETSLKCLQRVQTNSLNKFVINFLQPIYMKKGQSPSNSIIKYIQFLIQNRNGFTTWIERSITLIDQLHIENDKLGCALKILKAAPVPWPDSVNPLIKLRNSSHPLSTEINAVYELQQISVMKLKYGWPIDVTDNNMKFVCRMVKLDLPELFEDIHNFTKSDPQLQLMANFYTCYKLASNGDIEKSFGFFKKIEEAKKMECCEKIINIIVRNIEEMDDDCNDNIYEFVKLIKPHAAIIDQQRIDALINGRLLREKFNIKVSVTQQICGIARVEMLQKGLQNFVKNLKPDGHKNFVKYIWDEVTCLSSALNLEKLLGIVEIAKLLKNLNLTCALAYYARELIECTDANSDLLVELSVLVTFQQILISRLDQSEDYDPLAFPLAHDLLINTLNFKKIFYIKELFKWIKIGRSVYGLDALKTYFEDADIINKNVVKSLNGGLSSTLANGCKAKQKQRESFSSFDLVINANGNDNLEKKNNPKPVLRCLAASILLIILEMNPDDAAIKRYANYITEDIRNSVEEIRMDFYRSFEHLVKSKQHNSWYMIGHYLLKYQESGSVKIVTESFLSTQLRKMFRHLLTQKDPNFIDLFAMLLSDYNPTNFLELLWDELKNDQQKLNFSFLSEAYFRHIGDNENAAKNRDCRLKYFYLAEMCKESTLPKKIDSISMNHLRDDIKQNIIKVDLLEKFCVDFNWDYQEMLIAQITNVLNQEELSFELKSDSFGNEELIVKNKVEDVLGLCQPYVNEIVNTDMLAKTLLKFMLEINFYFYELYLCVIELLIYINALPVEMELYTNILIFLKHKMTTKRRYPPGQTETETWLQFKPNSGFMPKISKYRLPFIPIVQRPLHQILDDEINVDSCESWFPLIKLHTSLKLTTKPLEMQKHQDYFCMAAVKKSVVENSQRSDQAGVWNLQPINNAFLQAILRLVRHVSDKLISLQILYFVTNYAPEGADQVEAAYECYRFAIENGDALLGIPTSNVTIEKIKRKYPSFKTQHFLHIYGLAEDELLQLVDNPIKLINAMYHHESVLNTPKADFNKVAQEIAELHRLDFNSLQVQLLHKWFLYDSASQFQNLEETFYEDLNLSEEYSSTSLNLEYVARAHYILKSWDSKKALLFLIAPIFPPDGTSNTAQQVHMIECFVQLINDSNISFMDVVNQNQYIVIKCVHNLKQLGYNFTIDKFTEYDKLSILKKLWQNHAVNRLAMQVMADICLGFDIHVPKIWNGVLKQMVEFNMINELNSLVDTLSNNIELLYTDGLRMAWEYVLRFPFKTANRTRSDDQEEILSKSLFQIQGCPLVNKINLYEIGEDCIRLDRPHMAAVLIAFTTNKKQKDQIKMAIWPLRSAKLKKEIGDLEEAGILRNILNFVIKEIEL